MTSRRRGLRKLASLKGRKLAERCNIKSKTLKLPFRLARELARKITTRTSCTSIRLRAASGINPKAPKTWTSIQEHWRRCWSRFMEMKAQWRHRRWDDDVTIITTPLPTQLLMDINTSSTTATCSTTTITQCHVNQVSRHDSQDHGMNSQPQKAICLINSLSNCSSDWKILKLTGDLARNDFMKLSTTKAFKLFSVLRMRLVAVTSLATCIWSWRRSVAVWKVHRLPTTSCSIISVTRRRQAQVTETLIKISLAMDHDKATATHIIRISHRRT